MKNRRKSNADVRKRRFTGTAARHFQEKRYVQAKRMHPTQTVTPRDERTAEATFELTSTLEIRSWILRFGPAPGVLEPETLRTEIREEPSRKSHTAKASAGDGRRP